ncbi:MAG: hypothetical protein ACR2IN_01350 [Thermoleophilaceae bacterium]
MRHGGLTTPSAEEVAPIEQELEQIMAAAPLRDSNGEVPISDRHWARELAADIWRLRRVRLWLDMHGALDEKTGNVKPAAALELKLSQHVREGLEAMGMTPRSRARLGLDLQRTADLATAMSEPDPDRRRRLLAEAGFGEEDE